MQNGALISEFRALAFGPPVEVAEVNLDLPFGSLRNMGSIHRARRRPFKIDSFRIVPAAVARALELVFAGLPIGRAAEMSTDRRNHEDPLGVPHHPDSIPVLKLGVDAEA